MGHGDGRAAQGPVLRASDRRPAAAPGGCSVERSAAEYRELKDDLGIDHFEGRSYQGWTHHVVLTAVVFTFLQIERGRHADEPRPTLPVVRGWVREIFGSLYVIHHRGLLGMLDSFRRHAPLRR